MIAFSLKVGNMSDIKFYPVCSTEELPPGERLFMTIGEVSIVVFNIEGAYYAIADVCTHDEGELGDGEVEGFEIVCPRHGARFDIRTGEALSLPAIKDVVSYPIRVEEGKVEIGVREN